jgi:uncharacterized protein YuzE
MLSLLRLGKENKMKIEYDKEVDAIYIYLQLKDSYKTIEIQEGINIDLDEESRLIGLEILDATKKYSLSDIFNLSTHNLILETETAIPA